MAKVLLPHRHRPIFADTIEEILKCIQCKRPVLFAKDNQFKTSKKNPNKPRCVGASCSSISSKISKSKEKRSQQPK